MVADRSRLAELGTIAISFAVDPRGNFLAPPDLTARGVLLREISAKFLSQARVAAKRAFRQAVDDSLLHDLDALKEHVRRRMTRFFFDSIGQRAVCMVLVQIVKT